MTLKELKRLIKAKPLYVWVNWEGDDGSYIQVSKAAFLRGIGADVPFHQDGRHDASHINGEEREDGVYIG